jgi:hypothetical protein
VYNALHKTTIYPSLHPAQLQWQPTIMQQRSNGTSPWKHLAFAVEVHSVVAAACAIPLLLLLLLLDWRHFSWRHCFVAAASISPAAIHRSFLPQGLLLHC